MWSAGNLAGGGCRSAVFPPPGYQGSVKALVGAHCGVPDISMSAGCDPGVDVYRSFKGDPAGWSQACGTSEATPLFAGVVALADQAAGRPMGQVNADLYKMAAAATHPSIIDIVRGNNTVSFEQGGAVGGSVRASGSAKSALPEAGMPSIVLGMMLGMVMS